MADHVILIGAEEVRSAGSAMRSAADEIRGAASTMDSSLEGHQRFLDDWLLRFEAALEIASAPVARKLSAQDEAMEVSPITAQPAVGEASPIECHGLDTPERVCFYEQDFYVLSNFSSFSLEWRGLRFDTSEAAYHFEKFRGESYVPDRTDLMELIRLAPSAHQAFKLAEQNKDRRRADWDDVKVDIMRDILRAKVTQHEYVRRKLLATGDRELVENSWRDNFWGWGPNRDGVNMLGKLWMEIRTELRGPVVSGGDRA